MLAIALNEDELLQLKLLLRDIQLIQKLNNVFDYNAIEILSFKVIEHLNNEQDFMPKIKEISNEQIDKAADNYANKWIDGREAFYGFIEGAKWYREQLKNNK